MITASTILQAAAEFGPGGDVSGSELASWGAFRQLMIGFGLIVAACLVFGRAPEWARGVDRVILRIPNALQRVSGIPGWAAATVGTALYGLLVAGQGFYSDVAWHVALGRDEVLLTAPHVSIVVGLSMIFISGGFGVLFATRGRLDVGRRFAGVQVPWSTLPLFALGGAAVSGFPIDDVWHAEFGVDVTMWSVPHMIMIVGASLTGVAAWLVLAEGGVRATGIWGRAVHVVTAWLAMQGLVASLGEFSFGVPQFQQMFHPVILCLAAGVGIVAIRLVHGRLWALGIVGGSLLLTQGGILSFGFSGVGAGGGGPRPASTRDAGIFLASAVVVELIAWLAGTRHRVRFAALSGLAIGTLGFAGEFAYNARWEYSEGAYQPWTTALLPDAVILGTMAAVGGAVLGVALASAINRERIGLPPWALIGAGALVVVSLVLPMPRPVGDVGAQLTLDPVSDDEVYVNVALDPPDAARNARWFQAVNWQGGELRLAEMEEVAPGVYRSDTPVLITGLGKTMVRLHRGAEMMAVPVRMPADPALGEPEIPAVDRTGPFVSEQQFLLREQQPGREWIFWGVHILGALYAVMWAVAFSVAVHKLAQPGARSREQVPVP